MTDPRRTHRWKLLARQILATASHCEICAQPIDKHAPPRTRWAGSVDHIWPIETHPELAFEPTNLRPVHNACNARRRPRLTAPETTPRTVCPLHGSRTGPHCHPRRWIIAGCDIHGDQCPDLE